MHHLIFSCIFYESKIASVAQWQSNSFVMSRLWVQIPPLAHNLVMQVASMNPQTNEELLASPYIKDPNMTVESLIKSAIAKIGENIKVGKFIRYEI